MRKFLIAALAAAVAALALAGIAYATNLYSLPKSSTTGKAGKGSPTKPIAKGVAFDYTVKDSAGPRGAPVEQYKIAFQGLTTKYQSKFPSCNYNDTNVDGPLSAVLAKCRKAVVGKGRVESLLTLDQNAGDPNSVLTPGGFCNLELTLINIKGGLAIRLDADNTPPLPTSQTDHIGCIVPTHRSIHAHYKSKRIGGVPSGSLEFSVPLDLRHNSGFTITVARTTSKINLLKKKVKIKGKRRTVGFYSAIGCGKKREVRVTFVDENGVSSDAKGSGKC